MQTLPLWTRRNAGGHRLLYILECWKDVPALVKGRQEDEAKSKPGSAQQMQRGDPAPGTGTARGHFCGPGTRSSPLSPDASALGPWEALPRPASAGFHQASKNRFLCLILFVNINSCACFLIVEAI